jgi:quaternary ammonium compound-resistance protein SugE
MAWVYLVIAGILEVGWAVGMRYSDGFSKPIPSVLTIAAMVVSFALLSRAMTMLPIGTAYAVWVGIGAVGTAIAGMILFAEPATALRLFFLGMILAAIVGLKMTTKA